MSAPTSPEARQRLLPETLEHSFNDLAIRVVGGALVAFAVTSWLALLSWQLRESGPAHGAGKAARNLLGATGAGLSDMMVQTLGVAVVFALICPMVWGLELLANVRWLPRFRIKATAFGGALLALSGAASGLPQLPGWPLLGGSGGMLGDIVCNLAIMAGSWIGFDRDGWFVVAVLAGGGIALLFKSLGLGLEHLPVSAALRLAARRPAAAAVASSGQSNAAPEAAAKAAVAVAAVAEPAADVAETTSPPVRAAARPEAEAHVTARSARLPERVAEAVETKDDDAHDAEDDTTTDDTVMNARAFARRFAPANSTGVANGRAGRPKMPAPGLQSTLAWARSGTAYRKPSLNLLRRGPAADHGQHVDVESGARTLQEVLAAFGVSGNIGEARPGPVVTRYELEPARGTKIARVIGLADDFARELGAHAVRVSLTPGRTTIGIEVPNDRREAVCLRELIESEVFTASQMPLPLALGKGIAGEPVVLDLARMPHMLVAGTTGSGKSVGLNAMILSLLYRLEPTELRFLMIDPKMLELTAYDRIPHLLTPVVTDPREAAHALEWAVSEMEERYKRMARHSVRSIEAFNARVRSAAETGVGLQRTVHTGFDQRTGEAVYEREQLDDAPMPYIVIVIDELAELMVTAGRSVEASVHRLAQKARAAGIHLVVATQRPSVDVVTGTIKANLPVRISFRVASKIDSRTIINEAGAEQLLGHGDMLVALGSGPPLRVHGASVTADEVERVVQALRQQGQPSYVRLLARDGTQGAMVATTAQAQRAADAAHEEEMFASAVAVVLGDRKVSPGHLHHRLGILEAVADGLIERMQREGLVGPVNLLGYRPVLVKAPARAAARTVA